MNKNENEFTVNNTDLSKCGENGLTEEDIKKLNIPERDEASYPMPTQTEISDAGEFLFKLNLMASSLDLNLQALIWELYVGMDKYLRKDEDGASIKLAMTFEKLKEYLVVSNNPVFKSDK